MIGQVKNILFIMCDQLRADHLSCYATHAEQDQFLMPLDGRIDIVIGAGSSVAHAGEAKKLPRGIPRAFFDTTGKPVAALFWAEPAGQLVELYRRLHNVGSAGKAVAIAPTCGVVFEPPVSSAG